MGYKGRREIGNGKIEWREINKMMNEEEKLKYKIRDV